MLGFVRFLRQLRRDNPDSADPTWGAYGRAKTFNLDSVPISFCSSKRTTVEKRGSVRVSIQEFSALSYRVATLHLGCRAKGTQPYPTLVYIGQTDPTQFNKRCAEMDLYKDKCVHVVFQPNAWVDENLLVNKWAPCFEEDLARMGLEGQKTLVILDNLDAQRTPDFVQKMADMQCRCVYGPRNGTDVWQPIDHGIGVRYQNLVVQYYDEWCGTEAGQRPESARAFQGIKRQQRSQMPAARQVPHSRHDLGGLLVRSFFSVRNGIPVGFSLSKGASASRRPLPCYMT